jgi:hypothetical protein
MKKRLMKTLNIILVIPVLFCISYHATAQSWLWARQSGGGGSLNNIQEGFSIACDNAGNVYEVGLFYCDSITFGPLTLKSRSNGNSDFYLVKYDALGNVKWLKGGGGNNYDECRNVTVDSR